MLALMQSVLVEAVVVGPEYLMLLGIPDRPMLQRPKFIIVRHPEPARF